MTAAVPEDLRMTPMLKQYAQWKKRYPDCLLFFRMGDFYEMFFEDARVASSLLDITLTARDPGKKIPMAGVPFHSVDRRASRRRGRGPFELRHGQAAGRDPGPRPGEVRTGGVRPVGGALSFRAREDRRGPGR